MSKIILVTKPLTIDSFCDICNCNTKQVIIFKKYVKKKHIIIYHHKCLGCKQENFYEADIKFWVSKIVKYNQLDEN